MIWVLRKFYLAAISQSRLVIFAVKFVLLFSVEWTPVVGSDISNLERAIDMGDIREVAQLVQSGIDVNQQNVNGWSPLMLSASIGEGDIVAILIEAGARVDAYNDNGDTALMVAVFSDYPSIVDQLLAAGVNTFHINNKGYMATHIAEQGGHHAMVDKLSKYGVLSRSEINDVLDLLKAFGYGQELIRHDDGRITLELLSEVTKFGKEQLIQSNSRLDRHFLDRLIALNDARVADLWRRGRNSTGFLGNSHGIYGINCDADRERKPDEVWTFEIGQRWAVWSEGNTMFLSYYVVTSGAEDISGPPNPDIWEMSHSTKAGWRNIGAKKYILTNHKGERAQVLVGGSRFTFSTDINERDLPFVERCQKF